MYKITCYDGVHEYETIEELVEGQCSCICLEQQRMYPFIFNPDTAPEYDEDDDYDPIYCEICGEEAEDLYCIESIKGLKDDDEFDICSMECLTKEVKYILDNGGIANIEYIPEEKEVETYYCNNCKEEFDNPWYSATAILKNGEEYSHDELIPEDMLESVNEGMKEEYGEELDYIGNGEWCPECGESLN